MSLRLPGIDNLLFSHSGEFNTGMGSERRGAYSFVVSLDGTGDFDDISEAIDALPSSGGTIFIKEGDYDITKHCPLSITKSNITIQGVGYATRLYCTDAVTMLRVQDANHVTFKDLRIDGTDAAGAGIYLFGSSNCMINGCWVEDANPNILGGDSVSNNATNNIVSSCVLTSGGYGIYLGNNANQWVIDGNQITSNTNEGILIAIANDTIISNNVVASNGQAGINLAGLRNAVTGNSIYSNTDQGIMTSAASLSTITGNIIYSNGADGVYLGSAAVTVTGNIFSQNTGDGVEVMGAMSGNIIVGNRFNGDIINDGGTNTQIGHNYE